MILVQRITLDCGFTPYFTQMKKVLEYQGL